MLVHMQQQQLYTEKTTMLFGSVVFFCKANLLLVDRNTKEHYQYYAKSALALLTSKILFVANNIPGNFKTSIQIVQTYLLQEPQLTNVC